MAPTPPGAAWEDQMAPNPPWRKAPRLPKFGRTLSERTSHPLAVVAAAAAAVAVAYRSHQTIQASYHELQLAPTAQASDHEPQLAPTVRLVSGEERSSH